VYVPGSEWTALPVSVCPPAVPLSPWPAPCPVRGVQEKNNRAVALDCLHRLVHFDLHVYAQRNPRAASGEAREEYPKP